MNDIYQKALIVFGMYHSGISLLSEVLDRLDINLGRSIVPPGFPGGVNFSENEAVREIHEHLLIELGCRWDMIGNLPTGWCDSEAACRAENQLVSLIEKYLIGDRLWAVTDPHICELIPLWLKILDRMRVQPLFIVIIRHPFDVAVSLEKSDRWDLHKGYSVWLEYYREALDACREHPHAIVTCDQLKSDPLSTLKSIERALNVVFPRDIDSCNQALMDLVDMESVHYPCFRDTETRFREVFLSYDWNYDLIKTLANSETHSKALKHRLNTVETLTLEYFRALAASETRQIFQQERMDILDNLSEERLGRIESAAGLIKKDFAENNRRIDQLTKQLNQFHQQQRKETEKQLLENAYCRDIDQMTVWLRQLETDYLSCKKSLRWKTGNTVIRLMEIMLFRRRQPMVTDHLNQVFREYRSWLPRFGQGKRDQEFLVGLMRQIKNDLDALKASRRWQVGHAMICVLERLLLRRNSKLAIDHMVAIMDDYTRWADSMNGRSRDT